jgi:hypothetical protein
MMLQPTGRRTPVLALTAVAVALFVVGGILLVGRLGVPAALPSQPGARPSASPTDPTSTPEGVVRAFFDAYSAARRTDDPAPVTPFVTSTDSSAYLSVAAFLDGQKAANKASVVTTQRLDSLTSTISDGTATVVFNFTEGGYDIDLKSGSALESPNTLPAYQVTVILKSSGLRWLVDSYTSRP